MRDVLYEDLKIDVRAGVEVGKTAGGLKSTCESTLKKLTSHHKIPGQQVPRPFLGENIPKKTLKKLT